MKNKFWAYVAGFTGACFAALALGGLYFLTLQEGQAVKIKEKKNLSRQNAFYLRELRRNLLEFRQEAEKSLEEENRKKSSLFFALVFVDLKNNSVETILSPGIEKSSDAVSENLFQEFLGFVKTLDQKAVTGSSFQFLPNLDEDKNWLVFVTPLRSFPKSRGLLWVGLVKRKQFFKFSKTSDREALIINSQGRLFFSFQPQPGLFPSKAILKKFLKKAEQKKKTGWYVRRRGGNREGSNLFHIKPWPETNLFVLSGGQFFQPLFAWTDSSALWLLFCFSLWIVLFFGLVVFIRPLRLAYEALREEFISLAQTGKPRSLPNSRNPFLSFYGSLSFSEKTPPSANLTREIEPSFPFQTFQDLLRMEEHFLKTKFPGLNLTTQLDTDINLGQFQKPMKKILHELLLNAIEAMGSVESQHITVSAREEKDLFILSIRDRGPGLKEKEREKAFNLYYSTKSHLGVGLNLVQSIVSSYKGTIELASPSAGGLEVQISLPMECFSSAVDHPSPSFKERPMAELENRESLSSRALH